MSSKQSPTSESPAAQTDNASANRGASLVRGLLGVAMVLACTPLVVIAFATVTGLGLNQNVTSQVAIVGATLIVLLPGFGLASLLGGTAVAHGLSLGVWALVVLAALPAYFPGERETATRIGTTYLGAALPVAMRSAGTERALSVISALGRDRDPIARARSTADGNIAELDDDPLASDAARRGESNTTWIPYTGKGQSLLIPAHIDGPDFGEELQFIFDTGATLTTLSRDALGIVDIQIPDDAPEVTLRTASGELEAKLVLVDALWLQDELIEWVTIAVCEFCSNDSADGLLGLNVSSHYRVSIDHEAEEIEFVPRSGRRNRKLDIQPWLEINSTLTRWDDGRLELLVEARNRARRGIKSSVLEVRCANENFSVRLDPIPARGNLEQPASLPWGTECDRFEVQVLAAAWELDRS